MELNVFKCNVSNKYVSAINHLRHFSISHYYRKIPSDHYDTLGLTSKATLADIKKAYYDLSMLYHPDKNDGSAEAADKFRAVTDAYEILSNVKSRKLYDKGVVFKAQPKQSSAHPPKSKKPQYTPEEYGKTVMYNFELWSKMHYSDNVVRRAAAKQRYNDQLDFKVVEDQFAMKVVSVMLVLLTATIWVICEEQEKSLDRPLVENKD